MGETTTVVAAVITITTTGNTTMATTMATTTVNMEMVNTTMDNITMDNTTTATTTMVSAVDSQMEVMHRINKMKTNQPMSFHHDFPPFLSSSVLCLLMMDVSFFLSPLSSSIVKGRCQCNVS